MAFSIPTLDELHLFLIALLKALFPEIATSRTSFPALFARVLAAGSTDNHAHLVNVKSDLLPTSCGEEMLEVWGDIVGRPRKSATPARKADALRLVNDGGTNEAVTIGQELVHASGLRFQINENTTVNAGTEKDVDVVAIDTGSATRLEAGEILTFVTPPAFISESAELQLELDEDGDDKEDLGAYRARVLARFSTPPLGGAQEDYVQWALEIAGIAAAFCYPNRAGLGTVDVAALHNGTGSARLLTPTEVTELQAKLDDERPVSVLACRVLLVTTETVDIEVQVLDTGEEAYAWDWNDQVALFIATWDEPTRKITFTTNRPDTMQAGHRLVVKAADGSGTGAPLVIESLSGTDAVILEEVPADPPEATDTVYAGGALTEPVRNAILALVNGLGTANPDASSYGAWEGNLRTDAIAAAARDVAGVKKVVVDAPAADVEAEDPAFPDDDEIGLLVPGRVIVRRKW
jgi:uncharacterized phage protein gp47/JayE